ncbi:MAG: MlaD family protein [Fibrobacter sp.]|nr:MlaD family protein [Fibrobacter sp.]
MNRFVKLVRENLIPFIVFVILVVSCGGAWYLYHPSSPYHKRYSFVVRYDAIGTLSPGNRVEVRGISAGEITKVQLTEDAVYVTARVYATTKIPTNSEFRLINSGLMGEREMCVLTGDGTELIQDGDTLNGHYDEGTSGVGLKLYAMFQDISEIKDTLNSFLDSLQQGQYAERARRVIKKGKNIVNVAQSDIESWMGDVNQLIDKLDGDLEKAKSTLSGVVDQAGPKVDQVKDLLGRVDALLLKLNELKGQGENLLAKMSQDDNTVGLVLAKDGEFNRSIEKIVVDVDALLSDMKKNGIKLNIDIF